MIKVCIIVHTNFASKIRHENLESNYQILYLSNDVGYNLCKSFTIKENPLILHFKKKIRCKGLRLDLARTDLIFTDLSRLNQTTTSSRTWNLDFLIPSRLDCFDSSRLEFLNFCRASGLFLHSALNKLLKLSIYRAQERSLQTRFPLFSPLIVKLKIIYL